MTDAAVSMSSTPIRTRLARGFPEGTTPTGTAAPRPSAGGTGATGPTGPRRGPMVPAVSGFVQPRRAPVDATTDFPNSRSIAYCLKLLTWLYISSAALTTLEFAS